MPPPTPGTPHLENNDDNFQNSDNLNAKDNVGADAGSRPDATSSATLSNPARGNHAEDTGSAPKVSSTKDPPKQATEVGSIGHINPPKFELKPNFKKIVKLSQGMHLLRPVEFTHRL